MSTIRRIDNNKKAACVICGIKISLSCHSSSNIVAHCNTWYKQTATVISSALLLNDKRVVLVHAVAISNSMQSSMDKLLKPFKKLRGTLNVPKDITRRVTGVLLAESRKMLLEVFECLDLEEFIHCSFGTVDKSKKEQVNLLSAVYEIDDRMSANETGMVNVVSFTYEDWSANLGAPY